MKAKAFSSVVLGLVLSVLFILPAQAHDQKNPSDKEMQAKMEKAKKLGQPGKHHAYLNPLVGSWQVTNHSWMNPGDQSQVSSGTSTISWVLNGRFLKQEFKGNWAGETFNGLGYLGYDNVRKEYTSVWMDNMMTGMFQSTGQYNNSTRTLHEHGTTSCPMTGEKDRYFRGEWKIVSNNSSVYKMYAKDANGKEFKTMELNYKRIK